MDLHPLDKRYNVFSENPKDADGNITVRGSKLYWAIFAIMMFSTTCFIVWAYTKPRLERPFHYITASITMGIYYLHPFLLLNACSIGWRSAAHQRTND